NAHHLQRPSRRLTICSPRRPKNKHRRRAKSPTVEAVSGIRHSKGHHHFKAGGKKWTTLPPQFLQGDSFVVTICSSTPFLDPGPAFTSRHGVPAYLFSKMIPFLLGILRLYLHAVRMRATGGDSGRGGGLTRRAPCRPCCISWMSLLHGSLGRSPRKFLFMATTALRTLPPLKLFPSWRRA
ncbi:hypothetical protein JMJ77_0002584, partial [Colletotrichum scovillei]